MIVIDLTINSLLYFVAIHESFLFVTSKNKHCFALSDMNVDHLNAESSTLRCFSSFVTEQIALTQVIKKPNLIAKPSSTLIDLILATNFQNVKMHVVVITPVIFDHFLIFILYLLKKNKSKYKPKIVRKRGFRSFDEALYLRDIVCAPGLIFWRLMIFIKK